MKMIKTIFLTLIFAFTLNAQISEQTMSYLSSDNFTQAKTSIERDLSNDKFDAKGWYFYSKILYELNYPNAAKQALNNALNIDKSASFAKGGLNALRGFGGEILDAIDNRRNEPNLNITQISAEQYDAYLNQIFGYNHNFSNLNPPNEQDLARAQSGNYKASSQTSNYNSASNTNQNSYKQNSNEIQASGFSSIFIFVLLIVGIIILIKATKKPKKPVQMPNINQDELVTNINQLALDTEDLLKNVELINKNSSLYQELFSLNKSILLLSRNASLSPSLTIKQNYEKYKATFKLLEQYCDKRDYNLNGYYEKQKEISQQSLNKNQNFNSNVNLNGKNEPLYNRNTFKNQNTRQNTASSNNSANILSIIFRVLEFIIKIIFIFAMSNKNSGGSSRNSGSNSRNSNDDFWGSARGGGSNRNNSNDSFWGSARGGGSNRNNSNDSFWGSAKSSRSSNDDFWSSSRSSKGSKSDKW